MTLRDSYLAFLATPSTGALADNAALHYIPTLTTIQDATAIIKHLSVQEKLLKKKNEKVLDTVEGHNALSLDVETTIEFQNGGGAYLPGLDDNFVADRTVIFPMVNMRFRNHSRALLIAINRFISCTLMPQERLPKFASTGTKAPSSSKSTSSARVHATGPFVMAKTRVALFPQARLLSLALCLPHAHQPRPVALMKSQLLHGREDRQDHLPTP